MAGKEANRIFVGGLSWNVTERQLHDAFGRFGKIVECQILLFCSRILCYVKHIALPVHNGKVKIVMERDTGRPRGFGFITFANRRGMEDAILVMHGQEFGDRVISVNKANKAQQKMVGEDLEHGYWGGGYSSGGRGRPGGGDWSAGQVDCYNCGYAGHRARDCPLAGGEDLDHGYRGGGYSSGRKGSYGGGDKSTGKDGCFKCGRQGHWARDCPLTGADDLEHGYRGGGYSSGGRGSYGGGDRSAGKDGCFKCGRPGHWARDCFLAGGDRGGGGGLFSSHSRFRGGGGREDRYIDDHDDGGHDGDRDHFDNIEDNYGSRDHLHVGDRQEDLLGDFNLQEKEMLRLMQEGMRIKQEKLRLEQVKEEERIMMTDTSGMSQIQQKYYQRRKKEILQGRSRNS